MIRDPSDGSIRESSKPNSVSAETNSVSGLQTDNLKPDELARLQRSRKWIEDRRKGLFQCNTEAPDQRSSHPGNGE